MSTLDPTLPRNGTDCLAPELSEVYDVTRRYRVTVLTVMPLS